jgi:hypothetical protein
MEINSGTAAILLASEGRTRGDFQIGIELRLTNRRFAKRATLLRSDFDAAKV